MGISSVASPADDEVVASFREMDLAKPDASPNAAGDHGAIRKLDEVSVVDGAFVSNEPADNKEAISVLNKRKHPTDGRKMVKKRIRVSQETIDRLVQNPPSDPVSSEGYDHLPWKIQAIIYRSIVFSHELKAEQWDILHQYYTKGYAEIERDVLEGDE